MLELVPATGLRSMATGSTRLAMQVFGKIASDTGRAVCRTRATTAAVGLAATPAAEGGTWYGAGAIHLAKKITAAASSREFLFGYNRVFCISLWNIFIIARAQLGAVSSHSTSAASSCISIRRSDNKRGM